MLKRPDEESNTITVSFTLLGDEAHGEGDTTHTLKNGDLTTWLEATDYTVDLNATVKDVIEKALAGATDDEFSWKILLVTTLYPSPETTKHWVNLQTAPYPVGCIHSTALTQN